MHDPQEETHSFHSTYKGFDIYKVTQGNGRITYDIYEKGSSYPSINGRVEIAIERLAIAKATINSIIE